MKKIASIALAFVLLLTCVFAANQPVYASTKTSESRAIAIVFDNSGSMYDYGDKAWCRATYAMEVFASMLNKGDTLLIYPMHPITVNGEEFTMQKPFKVTDASQASSIREIYTPQAGGTPIESVDCAIAGIQGVTADNKYIIVLTDGMSFYLNNSEMSAFETKNQLDIRFQESTQKGIVSMYLGIGDRVVMPGTAESELFVKKQAKNSEDVLSALTDMCNRIFGRDTLPKNHISGTTIDFDISMKKLIVFVQGENVSDLKLSGSGVGQLISSASTKYGTAGCGTDNAVPDTTLQGMMVTYSDCAAGKYNIEFSGTASNIEVYYEPDADLDFVFTDSKGNAVNYNALYEGDYKVSFGMKDGKTGKLLNSDLLGNPHYQGYYSINGEEHEITYDGQSGEVPVTLMAEDNFNAGLTVTYLSGYTISKSAADFGWPPGGLRVESRPAGTLTLEISGGAAEYSLQYLEEGTPFTAKIWYEGELLTGKELEKTQLKWNPDESNVELKKTFAEDHWDITLHYKDPSAPQNTVCGECTVTIYAHYTAEGTQEAVAECPISYVVIDDFSPLQVQLFAPDDYIVISEIDDCRPIEAQLVLGGAPLEESDFSSVELLVDCEGLEFELEPDYKNSRYNIKLVPAKGIDEGDYRVKVTALYTDNIGRVTESGDFVNLTLSNTPLWLKWLIGLLALLVLIVLTVIIMRIKVLPKKTRTTRQASSMVFDGEDVTIASNFAAEIKNKRAKVETKYAGKKFGVTMDVTPGPDSFLSKSQKKRSALVKPASVKKFGSAKIMDITIGGVKFKIDDDTGILGPAIPTQKPFLLKNGMRISYSGTINDAGVDKDFESASKLIF